MAVGLYSVLAGAAAAAEAADEPGRLPRARPDPRLLPNVEAGALGATAGGVAAPSAGVADDSGEDMYLLG